MDNVRIADFLASVSETEKEAQVVLQTIHEALDDHVLLELLDLVEDLVDQRVQIILSHALRDTEVKVSLESLPDGVSEHISPLLLDKALEML